jgi:hypothetical protein
MTRKMACYSTGGLPILIITFLLAHILVILPTLYNHGTFRRFITLFPYDRAGYKAALYVTGVTRAGCVHSDNVHCCYRKLDLMKETWYLPMLS